VYEERRCVPVHVRGRALRTIAVMQDERMREILITYQSIIARATQKTRVVISATMASSIISQTRDYITMYYSD